MRRLPAAQKLALTGTPVENRLAELWAILDAVNPGPARQPAARSAQRFATPIERDGDREAAARLRTPHAAVRAAPHQGRPPARARPARQDRADRVRRSSPRSRRCCTSRSSTSCSPTPRTSRACSGAGCVLAALTRLKQICNHPAHALGDGSRARRALGQARRASTSSSTSCSTSASGRSCSRSSARWATCCSATSRERFGLRGAVPARRRVEGRTRRGWSPSSRPASAPPLLLVSLKAGGTGLNLTAASQVIHYDRWWNPAVEDQATDRAWRIGQRRTVNVHKLVCAGHGRGAHRRGDRREAGARRRRRRHRRGVALASCRPTSSRLVMRPRRSVGPAPVVSRPRSARSRAEPAVRAPGACRRR